MESKADIDTFSFMLQPANSLDMKKRDKSSRHCVIYTQNYSVFIFCGAQNFREIDVFTLASSD